MQLIEQRDEGLYLVRAVEATAIEIGDRRLEASFLLSPEHCEEGFPVRSLDGFDAAAVAAIMALEPAVVLIGTGMQQQLPAPALMAQFMGQGIGLETMDSRAAARTYNLLASEGRRVVAVFLL